jgi:hypothetical protein
VILRPSAFSTRRQGLKRPQPWFLSHMRRLGCIVLGFLAAGTLRAQSDARILGHHDALILARSIADGRTDGITLVATRPGATAAVADQILGLGGTMLARFDDVGYLRARLPLARLHDVLRWPDVVAVSVDAGGGVYAVDQATDLALGNRLSALAAQVDHPPPVSQPPLPDDSREPYNPLVPIADIGVKRLRDAHPTFDGRGVTIGLVSRGGVLDVAHSAFRTALDVNGRRVPKIAGIVDPRLFVGDIAGLPARQSLVTIDTLPDPARVVRRAAVDASNGTFVLDGATYRAPHGGHFSVGTFAPPGAAQAAVVWDSTGRIWIDLDRNGNLSDDRALVDINTSFRIESLPPAPSAGSQPWTHIVAAIDSGGAAVHVYTADDWHETMVASTAAGDSIVGGGATGVAPAARLIVVRAGPALWEGIEAFVRAERDPRIDIISSSTNWERFPSAGQSILSLILSRAIARYGKPIIAGAQNNGPVLSSTGEPGTTPDVISVGAVASAATMAGFFGWHLRAGMVLLGYSSRGPTRAGGLGPDLVAPALSLAADACADGLDNARTLFRIPLCWQLGKGSSDAAPMGAGAAGLVVRAT